MDATPIVPSGISCPRKKQSIFYVLTQGSDAIPSFVTDDISAVGVWLSVPVMEDVVDVVRSGLAVKEVV